MENVIYLSDRLSVTPGLRLEFIDTGTDGRFNQLIFDNAGNAIGNNELTEVKSLSRKFLLGGLGLSYNWTPQVRSVRRLS